MYSQVDFWSRTPSPVALVPYVYRETPILLPSGRSVMVAGLAKLDASLSVEETCKYLKDRGIQVIFGMHVRQSYLDVSASHELVYVPLHVPDFTAPGVQVYDEIFEALMSQARAGKKIAIHCHGGLGRTGTVLAALKFRELSMQEGFHWVEDALSYYIPAPAASCSENVFKAIEFIRSIPGSEYAIEDESQIASLIEYEAVLKQRHFELSFESCIPS